MRRLPILPLVLGVAPLLNGILGASASAQSVSVSGSQTGQTVLPAAAPVQVFRVVLDNRGLLNTDKTLTSIRFENLTTGPGTQAQRDAEWQTLELTAGLQTVEEGVRIDPEPTYTANFVNGVAQFNVAISVPANSITTLNILGGASLVARDGDVLDLRIPSGGVTVSGGLGGVSGSFPISPAGNFPVDGMSAAQIALTSVVTPILPVGSARNLTLDVVLPANGYQTDLLQRFAVQNAGTARPADEIGGMELWLDDGDGKFQAALDTRLGGLAFTGDRWQISGLSVPVPLAGIRVFVTTDVAEQAEAGRTVRLSIPTLPDVGVGMASANDGPIDRSVANPSAQAIAVVDRITLAFKPLDPGPVAPGAVAVPMLELVATNTYSVAKQLTGLTVANATLGPGNQAALDAELDALALREDADDDGILDPAKDPLLATAFFLGGRASFGGFAWDLPAAASRRLFVTGDVSRGGAADGDVLRASILGAADFEFAEPTAISASFPLGPGSSWSVDGMVAAEVENRGAHGTALGPNDGPALGLDVVVHRNGYQDDTLTRLTVDNQGSATAADLAELHLWRDGGDGGLGGDDQDLGPLAPVAGGWASGSLAVPLGSNGVRLFVSITVGPSPIDSATVQLAVPVGGLEVSSGNDGPIDDPVVNPDVLLLANRALIASLDVQPDAVTVGQPVTVRMTARNASSETINNVTPAALTFTGTAGLSYAGGPAPASANLAPGAQQVYSWSFDATSAGDGRFNGGASGVGASSGAIRDALPISSDLVRVFSQAEHLPWTASSAMPLSVNRGQTQVVPLFLTFGDDSASFDARVTAIRLRLESESGSGIVPADLISRIAVQVGTTTHVERTSLENAGSDVDLTLATPILVGAGGTVSAAISLDVGPGTVVPNFRLVIPDSTYLVAEDAATGAPVKLALEGQTYPWRTGLARVVAEATELDVAAVPGPALDAGQGQTEVPFATLRLTNPGVTGVTSDVRVASFVVTLRAGAGALVAMPASVVERLRVRVGPQLLADRPITASEDSLIELTLSPLLSVPVNAPLDVRITADLADQAAVGTYRLELGDSSLVDARDPNSGNRVSVVYAATPVASDPVTVETAAESLAVLGVPQMPASTAVGSQGVVALHAILRHPGAPGAAAIRVDSLVVRCVDEGRNPLAPGLYVERLHARWQGSTVATLADPPASGNTMMLGLPGLALEPGARDTLTLVIDFEVGAPPTSFELILAASGLIASDANTREPVTTAAESGFEFPILSGLVRLAAPARTLIAGLDDRMPATFAADGAEVTAGDITLANPAAAGSGSITVDRLDVRAADAGHSALAIGDVAAAVRLVFGAATWAAIGLQPGDSVAVLSGAPLDLGPQTTDRLALLIVPRSRSFPGFRLGFAGPDVGVVQPANSLLEVSVEPPAGASFPLWTQFASLTTADLEASYSNFPNPFAAGREATRFAYYLPAAGRVTLSIWTPRGQRVASLVENAPRAAGLHQSDAWDGRNGRGDVVLNGVYVAEMTVRLDDGGTRRLVRKVAVVR
ncbi:MAG TPA: hypothetical protein VGK93_07860 [Candidatus Eisenbacteria bacterium]|jgi:hypothetical protein